MNNDLFLLGAISKLQQDSTIKNILGAKLLQQNALLGTALLTGSDDAMKAAIIQEIK